MKLTTHSPLCVDEGSLVRMRTGESEIALAHAEISTRSDERAWHLTLSTFPLGDAELTFLS